VLVGFKITALEYIGALENHYLNRAYELR